jgi:Uma2 family endonuclease
MTLDVTTEPQIITANNGFHSASSIPPLEAGARLTRSEFERRYHAMPHVKKAELIEGVVYMPSPVRYKDHGKQTGRMTFWLGAYHVATSHTDFADNTTVLLDPDNEPQPDVFLRLDSSVGGKSWVNAKGYLEGAPELIVEVAASSESYDLHEKLRAYRRNGVQEYVVWCVYDQQIYWYKLEAESYVLLSPDRSGVIRSQVFPGLQLDVKAMLKEDLAKVLAVLQKGLGSPEHKAFVRKLKKAKR